jgi:hypothetical protein
LTGVADIAAHDIAMTPNAPIHPMEGFHFLQSILSVVTLFPTLITLYPGNGVALFLVSDFYANRET